MARFYPNGAGAGGVTSSEVTVSSYDVPKSKTALTSDSDDGVIYGKLEEYSSAVEAANSKDEANKRIMLTIPKRGLYTPSAKLFATYENVGTLIGLNEGNLANGQKVLGITGGYKGLGDATPADVRTGKKFSTAELSDADGAMPEQGGSVFVPGVSNKTAVAADRYVTGDVIVSGDPNLVAENIKKGSMIFGVTGSWDGFVPGPSDIYNRGSWGNGFTKEHFNVAINSSLGRDFINESSIIDEERDLKVIIQYKFNPSKYAHNISTQKYFITGTNKWLNFSGYSKLNITFTEARVNVVGDDKIPLTFVALANSGSSIASLTYRDEKGSWIQGAVEKTVSLDISHYNGLGGFQLQLYNHRQSWDRSKPAPEHKGSFHTFYIHRIWFE